jgi:2-haloacid dehalogenase
MIKAIIFDFGSVIYKTDWKGVNKDFKEKFGFEILLENKKDEALINIYNGANYAEVDFKEFFFKINPKISDIDQVIKYYKKFYFKNKILNKDLIKLIAGLKKKYGLYGFTDIQREHYEANLEGGLYKHFNKIFTSFEFKRLKADEGAFEMLTCELEKFDIRPEECIFIDDNLTNIQNAEKAGFRTIHYDSFPDVSGLKDKIEVTFKK